MGATSFMLNFVHYDWKVGVKELRKKALQEKRHSGGYSGDISELRNLKRHIPTVAISSIAEAENYVGSRSSSLGRGDGEIIDLGVYGHSTVKPVTTEMKGRFLDNDTWERSSLKRFGGAAEFYLIVPNPHRDGDIGMIEVVETASTMEALIAKAEKRVLAEKFERDYVIDSNNISKPLLVSGAGRMTKVKPVSVEPGTIVVQYNTWFVYGKVRE